jgi:uncharacterized membrane protein
MNYLKYFRQALLYSAIIFAVGFLHFWGLNFYVLVLSALCFLFSIIHDAGRDYMKLTRQSVTNRYIFNVIVNPPYVFLCIVSLLYVFIGKMYWFSWALAGLVTLSVYATWFSEWMRERNKTND